MKQVPETPIDIDYLFRNCGKIEKLKRDALAEADIACLSRLPWKEFENLASLSGCKSDKDGKKNHGPFKCYNCYPILEKAVNMALKLK
jgi:hypothetical protein